MKTPGTSYWGLRYAIALAMSTAPLVPLDRAEAACDPAGERLLLPRPRASSVAGFRKELERAAFRALFHEAGGDFEKMSRLMTGSSREARAAIRRMVP